MTKIYVVIGLNVNEKNTSAEDIGVNAFSTREKAEDHVVKSAVEYAEEFDEEPPADYESAIEFLSRFEESVCITEITIS
jgi:hypothetical protein